MGGLKKLLSGDSNVGRENSARVKKQTLAYGSHVLKNAPEKLYKTNDVCSRFFICFKILFMH